MINSMLPLTPRPLLLHTILLLSSLLFLPGCDRAGVNAAQTGSADAAAPLPQVGIVEIRPRPVALDTELAGRTTSYLIAEVRPQVSGIILDRAYEEGSRITVGQLLYRIDPATYQAAYDSAVATLRRDEAAMTRARLTADRYRELLKTKSVSQEVYDDAAAALKQAKATVDIDKAALESARINLDYTRVTAPISGRIGRSNVTQGALVTASQATPLATIQQYDPIYVDVTQSSAELLRLKRILASGQLQPTGELDANVALILEDGTNYAHRGRLQFTEVSVDENTGSVTLRAVFPNPEHQLLPGMYVRAVITEGVKQAAILAPQKAVTRDAKGRASAMVLGSGDRIEQRNLTLDRAVGNQWLVTAGLQPGDRLIVDGLQKVRPGIPASAVNLDTDGSNAAGSTN